MPGEANYGTPSATYQAGKGYDQATGLGSVNVTNLINQWTTVAFNPTTTTFSISPTSAVHGSPVNVSGTVTPNNGSGIPTGPVWLTQYQRGNLVGDGRVSVWRKRLRLQVMDMFCGAALSNGTNSVRANRLTSTNSWPLVCCAM